MKKIIFILVFGCFFFLACTLETNETPLSDPADHNMKFIPEKPTAADDIKLVVFDDCTYNVLSGVKRNGKIIDIRKHFNSMMKLPCLQQNDTISIGQLPEGTYTVNYKLVDLSTEVKDSISLSYAFALTVAK